MNVYDIVIDTLNAEYTDSVLAASFVYDDGIDHPIAMITDTNTYYYHTDTRSNIAMVTDETGNVVERYSYDPYGKVTITDDAGTPLAESAIDNPYMYSSRRYDETTTLYYYRNRAYSPELGRFLQRDPEEYADSMNLYAYVVNNPVNKGDPYGLMDPTAMGDQRRAVCGGARSCVIDMTPGSPEEAMLQEGIGYGLAGMGAVAGVSAVYSVGPYIGAELVGVGVSNLKFAIDVAFEFSKGFMWGYANIKSGMPPDAPHKAMARWYGRAVGWRFKKTVDYYKDSSSGTIDNMDTVKHPKKP